MLVFAACRTVVLPRLVMRTVLLVDMMLFAAVSHAEHVFPLSPQFQFSAASAKPVVEYTLVHQMLAAPDPEPLLRVYGNGRVHVHFPVYMKKAGDYELQLSPAELGSLIRTLARDGVIDFDPAAARNTVQQLEEQRRESGGSLSYISDSTVTVIDIALDRYQSTPSTRAITNLRKKFVWKNLQHEARSYPQSQALRRAASSADKLHAFTNRSDLERIR